MFRTLALAALAIFMATPSRAAIVIGGTRVVFPAASRDVSLKIQNKGNDPSLVQVWIDDGDEASTPATAKAPFAITPPVFRIDPGQGHTLRIVHVGDTLPRERESLYWLNVLEIPPKAEESAGKNVLQLAFRHRIKLFHRPVDLPTPPEKAVSMLRWTVERDAGGTHVRVDNPSPYHVSFNSVNLPGTGPGSAAISLGGGMVAPGGRTRFAVPAAHRGVPSGDVRFVTISDFGGTVAGSATMSP